MKNEIKKMDSEAARQESGDKFPAFILGFCLLISSCVWFLPRQYIDGNLVPALRIFIHSLILFHALIIAVIFSFSGASGALLVRYFSGHATVWRFYLGISLVSMELSSPLMASTELLEIFRLVCSGLNLWRLNEDRAGSFFFHNYVFQGFRKFCPAIPEFSEIT